MKLRVLSWSVFVRYFGLDGAQRSIAFLIILILLTPKSKNVSLIHSVTIYEQKQRTVHRHGASNVDCSTVVLISDHQLPDFITSNYA